MASTTWGFDAIGTRWQIETPQPLNDKLSKYLEQRIACFDAVYSRFRTDSLISRIATQPRGRFEFPADARALFGFYDRLAAATDGAVDPLIGRNVIDADGDLRGAWAWQHPRRAGGSA
ncbi:FAD:protein FMN transferase [Actinoplanes sp. NBC_00393]|uniref:FAD:protein FMN transferase n=1 Tax=Actinoplanes sp. NBC_00393 TaxID=2975953 RepID=UPI002E243BA4